MTSNPTRPRLFEYHDKTAAETWFDETAAECKRILREDILESTDELPSAVTAMSRIAAPRRQDTLSGVIVWNHIPSDRSVGWPPKVKEDPDASSQAVESTVEGPQQEVKTESHQVQIKGEPNKLSLSHVLANSPPTAPPAQGGVERWRADRLNPTFSVSQEELTALGLQSQPAGPDSQNLHDFARTVVDGEPLAVLLKTDEFWSVYLPEKRATWSLQGASGQVRHTEKWIPKMDEITEIVPSSNRAVSKRLARRLYKGIGRISGRDRQYDRGVARAATRLTIIALSATDLSTARLMQHVNCDNLTFEFHSAGAAFKNGHWTGLSKISINQLSLCDGAESCEEVHLSQRGIQ